MGTICSCELFVMIMLLTDNLSLQPFMHTPCMIMMMVPDSYHLGSALRDERLVEEWTLICFEKEYGQSSSDLK